MLDALAELIARCGVLGVQCLPLRWAGRLGRVLGGMVYHLDRRHRNVALRNVQQTFQGAMTTDACLKLARENFKRIGESFCCAIKTASMDTANLQKHALLTRMEGYHSLVETAENRVVITAIGHFGNFELYARIGGLPEGMRRATTYRGLKQPGVNRVLKSLRERSGCLFFERRSQARELRDVLSKGNVMLGLLADQHAGDRGLTLPFFGRPCSTSAAPALLALRYKAPLIVAICHRTALARWDVEFGPVIPTQAGGMPRSPEAIMADVNRAFEDAIRRDPANWFWVHNRWKPIKERNDPHPAIPPMPTAAPPEHP